MAADPGRLIFVAYPATDPLGTAAGTLTRATDKSLTVEDNGAGSGSFTINRNDPQAAWCAIGAYVIAYRDTVTVPADAIGGFWVENIEETVLSDEENGGELVRCSGRGPIAYLAEAIAWHRARAGSRRSVQRRRRRWHWKKAHPAKVLVRMLEEAQKRKALPALTRDFTRTTDSDGDPWDDDAKEKANIPIGVNLLELIDILRDSDLYVHMGPDLELHAWETHGADLSASVTFTKGVDIRGEVQRQQAAWTARSHILVEGENKQGRTRYRPFRRKDFRQELGRREEGFFRYERTATRRRLRRVGRKKLRNWHKRYEGPFTLPVIDTTGQVALVDYTAGDSVTVDVPGVWDEEKLRIASITLTETDAGEYDPTLEFEEYRV